MKMRSDTRRGGFTLIEVIITLCVFVLLAGAVLGIFSATLESAASLQDDQNRNDETEALGAWLKQSLLDLPAGGAVTSYHRDGIPFHVSGIIWGAGENLEALDLHLQANGNYLLRLATYEPPASSGRGIDGLTTASVPLSLFTAQVVNDNPALAWRPLVRDLKSANWRFRYFGRENWLDSAGGAKPVIAEFNFQVAGASDAITDDFWIPPTQPASNPALTPSTSTVTTNP
jgi:prepilin-type N-terminal cleavage/methylation domain-containing protein